MVGGEQPVGSMASTPVLWGISEAAAGAHSQLHFLQSEICEVNFHEGGREDILNQNLLHKGPGNFFFFLKASEDSKV